MKAATKDLWKTIEREQVSKNQFTNEQLMKIKAGNEKIPSYTWHHNAQSSPNNMQLIPNSIYKAVRHTGQKSLKKDQ
ncbi:HNH endonuclease [Neisseria basseii]|uniref:HNH endonuclease n=1 Tax=Neisseria basseii TaxID=2830650 RepID=UPI00265879B9|nr:HNH endonuclease [Neisseria basseii]